jgi:ribose-phosphate pyrophosphokinase
MSNFKIFSGTANPPLAEKISKILTTPLGKIEIVRFADSEVRVRIEEEVAGKTCYVIASLSNPVDTHLVEFCLIVDALKQNEAQKIIGVIPYFGYARQDKAHRPGEGVSARVMAKLIEAVGVSKIITVDLHSEAVASFFNVSLVHLFGLSIFLPEISKLKDDLVIIAPDAGGAKRAQKFAESLGAPLALIEKKRDLQKLHTLEVCRVIGEVKDKVCVVVDDVITGGGTAVEAARLLKEKGAKKVIACATHPDFVEGTRKNLTNSKVDKVYVSDTILVPPDKTFPKLEIVSIGNLIAETIRSL